MYLNVNQTLFGLLFTLYAVSSHNNRKGNGKGNKSVEQISKQRNSKHPYTAIKNYVEQFSSSFSVSLISAFFSFYRQLMIIIALKVCKQDSTKS